MKAIQIETFGNPVEVVGNPVEVVPILRSASPPRPATRRSRWRSMASATHRR